jgi:DNA-binding CsgD family transcriptional regulator
MRSPCDLSTIEAAFTTAANDASSWNGAMEVVAASTGSSRAILLPVPQGRSPILRLCESLRPTREINYLDGWVQCDLGSRGVSKLLRDCVVTNFDCKTLKEIDCDPLYPGATKRISLPYFAGVKVAANDKLFCLVIQRSNQLSPFCGAELKKLASISPALSRAATAARAQGLKRAEGALNVFSVFGWPAFLLDHYGQLIRMNQSAERIVGGDVAICGRQVVSYQGHVTAALTRQLRYFTLSNLCFTLKPLMSLPRKADGRPLLACALRLSAISPDVFARRQVILKFTDLEEHPQPSQSVLSRCFALSPAEARLASGLAGGKRLEMLAEELTISMGTARQELKSVFAKLDVHRQSELVALLSTPLLNEQI